jgi:ATP-dependent DNA helicase RecQ
MDARNARNAKNAKNIKNAKDGDGVISVCRLATNNFYIPVVNAVIKANPEGSTCVVAKKNDDVLSIVGLFIQNGIAARQIQSNSSFSLYNLVEVRDYVEFVYAEDDGYTISPEAWQAARAYMHKKHRDSVNLPGIMKLAREFEEVNNQTMYKSDFKQFMRESMLEDFISESETRREILVSTIHQTKGREFDNVFFAAGEFIGDNDRSRREVYVAVTRAIHNLHIFCGSNEFDGIGGKNVVRTFDGNGYPEPSQICLPLSHKDVALGYFGFRSREISRLIPGQELTVNEEGCYLGDSVAASGVAVAAGAAGAAFVNRAAVFSNSSVQKSMQVLKFSQKFLEQVAKLRERGYTPSRAVIRHILFWQDKDKISDEIKIILPNIEFTKQQ